MASADEPQKQLLALDNFRFTLGDELAWSDPDFDDSQWREITVPGGWMAQGFKSTPYVGWYRSNFRYSADTYRLPALVVGQIRGAYEVFLNGKLLGRSGRIDRRMFYAQEPQPRVFDIPNETLLDGQENVLALRVQRIVTDGGVRTGPLGIGEESELRLHFDQQLRRTFAWEAAFLMFYGSTLLFSLILWVLGFRDARHLWFGIVILQIGLSHFLHSNLLEAMGGTNYWTIVVANLLDQCFPFSTLMFLKHTFQVTFGKWLRTALLVYGTVCLAWWINIHTINNLYFVWVIMSMLIFSPAGLYWCVQGIRRGHPDALPLLIGSTGLFVLISLYITAAMVALNQGTVWSFRWTYVPVDWYAWLCVHLGMIYTLAARYERTRKQLRKTSQGILQSHEEERKRVARELHDGVGQLLSAVKLRLDVLGEQSNLPATDYVQQIQQSALETDRVFDELRRVASGLRPEALQRKGLLDAAQDLASAVTAHSKALVAVDCNAVLNGRIPGADHIYRIIQESVNNAIRHGQANQIQITLDLQQETLNVKIEDDGIGFDTTSLDHPAIGLGLASMQERAELLGGRLRIASKLGEGTQVIIEELAT